MQTKTIRSIGKRLSLWLSVFAALASFSALGQQCDIVVQGTPTISPNPATAGNSITVRYTIHNNGPANAGSSQTKIQIKNSGGTAITQPTFSAPAVNASANSAVQASVIAIPAGTPAGTYTAIVILSWCDQNWKGLCDQNWNNHRSAEVLLAARDHWPAELPRFSGG